MHPSKAGKKTTIAGRKIGPKVSKKQKTFKNADIRPSRFDMLNRDNRTQFD